MSDPEQSNTTLPPATTLVDYGRLRRLAGPNDAIAPGKSVFCFGSEERSDPEWMARFRREAERHGADVVLEGGVYYVVFEPEPLTMETITRKRVSLLRFEAGVAGDSDMAELCFSLMDDWNFQNPDANDDVLREKMARVLAALNDSHA